MVILPEKIWKFSNFWNFSQLFNKDFKMQLKGVEEVIKVVFFLEI